MGQNRNLVCVSCLKDFSYYHAKGPIRKKCFECSPRNKKGKTAPFNAYSKNQVFSGLRLPFPWNPAKNGSGNVCRWVDNHLVTLFDKHGRFAVAVNVGPKTEFRDSRIKAEPANVSKAMDWAENVAQALGKSYKVF